MSVWARLSEHIGTTTGSVFALQAKQAVGGGCINSAYRLQGGGQDYFLKLNAADRLAMFEAEAAGLLEIATTQAVRVPRPICWGCAGDRSYLVLEYLQFGNARESAMEALGRQLALLHQTTRINFGWHRDNTIGSTPQINAPCADWVTFWRQHRLGFQLDLAARNGYGGTLQRDGGRLMASFAALFEGHAPVAALLHGDLWSGNAGCDERGCPVLFDPAVYYGDRETDLAMTELFGGFSPRFHAAYREACPVDEGYRVRKTLYNLYHVLNHLNLFGGGYLTQAQRMIASLLAELG